MKRVALTMAVFIVASTISSAVAADLTPSGPNGWLFNAGVSYFKFAPNLPKDLSMHNTHPDDRSFMTGSPGNTKLNEVQATLLNLSAERTWGIVKRTDYGWEWGLSYVLKMPLEKEGREEKQNENDIRPPTEGSFIYTKITDLKPAHEIGAALRYWWVAGNELFCIVTPAVYFGYWQLAFEKGWNRFGRDEAEYFSDAKGFSLSPQLSLSVGTKELRLSFLGAYRIIDLKYDTSTLGSSIARGWEVGGLVGWHF